jgi:hypothetical protein
MKFRKKPVVIDALRWTGINAPDILTFTDFAARVCRYEQRPVVEIDTLEGVMRGEVGDWIIRGIKGEFYPCKPDIFAATYEAVEAVEVTQ